MWPRPVLGEAPVRSVRFVGGGGEIVASSFLSGTAGSTAWDLIPCRYLCCNGCIPPVCLEAEGADSSAFTADGDGHLPCPDTLSFRSYPQPWARCPAGLGSASDTAFQGQCLKAAPG